MPRNDKNARPKARRKKLKLKKPKAVLIWVDVSKDNITPGRLVAAAEWREIS